MSLGDKMLKGVFWSSIEKVSVQAISFILGIVLARLLTPTEYGTVGLLIVFISISQVFIDGGFSKALIQKQDRTSDDISTVFFFNLIIALGCYIILWFTAPFIADFYEIPKLIGLLRVLSLSLIFNGLFALPNTLLSIDMNFKALSKVTLTATIISGLIAVYLAYDGYGEWALVWQTLIRTFLMTIIIWYMVKWKPNRVFSKKSFNRLFSFGSKLLISSLLNNLTNNFSSLFIAKIINAQQLGFYTRGTQFADTIFSTINTVLNNVLLPGLAPLQDQIEQLVSSTRKILKSAAIVVVPLFLALALLAKPLILILLTEKWLEAVPIMQIICIARLITILSAINLNVLFVIGRSDLALRQQYLKIFVRILLLVIALPYGIFYVALAELAATIIHFFINTYYPGKLMKYGALNQLKDFFKIFGAGIGLAASMYLVTKFIDDNIVSILVSVIVGSAIYILILKALKESELQFLLSKISNYVIKKN